MSDQFAGPMPRFIDALAAVGGLTGADIANITDVSRATMSRRKAGSVKPQPDTRLVLSDLHFIQRFSEFYTADETRTWLHAMHPRITASSTGVGATPPPRW